MKRSNDRMIIGRREFLKRGMLAGVGVSILPLARAANASSRLRRTFAATRRWARPASRFPTSHSAERLHSGDEDLVRHAFDRGINYFDCADTYTGGESETVDRQRAQGQARQGLPDLEDDGAGRRQARIDDDRARGQPAAPADRPRRRLLQSRDQRSSRSRIPSGMNSPSWRKQQGKIRFTGMSGHAGNLIECLDSGSIPAAST